LIIFSDKIEKFIPPRKGKQHVLRVIREILFFKPEESRTDLNVSLEYLTRVIKRRCIVFLISDFLTENYEKSLQVVNKKHDIIAINIVDPREVEMPSIGFVELEDAESGETIIVDTTNPAIRGSFYSQSKEERDNREKFFKSIGVDNITIKTDQSYVEPITKFFRMRARRLAY
jgi:uncharacterized protein (DUF58 family)